MTIGQIQPLMGVRAENIEQVLNVLIKEGKVKKDGELYKAVPKK